MQIVTEPVVQTATVLTKNFHLTEKRCKAKPTNACFQNLLFN